MRARVACCALALAAALAAAAAVGDSSSRVGAREISKPSTEADDMKKVEEMAARLVGLTKTMEARVNEASEEARKEEQKGIEGKIDAANAGVGPIKDLANTLMEDLKYEATAKAPAAEVKKLAEAVAARSEAPTPARMEVGLATVYGSPSNAWRFTAFKQRYAEPPVVVLLPSTAGGNPSSIRIRGVTAAGFESAMVEPPGEDGPHVNMRVPYIAVEEGVHKLPGGELLEAGMTVTTAQQGSKACGVKVDGSWDTVAFRTRFPQPPAVLAMVQTMNNERSTPPRRPSSPQLDVAVSDIKPASFKLALERSTSPFGSVDRFEQVGFIAVQAGAGSIKDSGGKDVRFVSQLTPKAVVGWGDGCRNVKLATALPATPLVLANLASRDGEQGGWLRYCRTNPGYVGLTIDMPRECRAARARKHGEEAVSLLAFQSDLVLVGAGEVKALEAPEVKNQPPTPTKACLLADPAAVDTAREAKFARSVYERAFDSLAALTTRDAFFAALAAGNCDVAVVPELERGTLARNDGEVAALRKYVSEGGRLVLHGGRYSLSNVWKALDSGAAAVSARQANTAYALGEPVSAQLRATLPSVNVQYGLRASSLSAASVVWYRQGDVADVVTLPLGRGDAVYVSFDLYDARFEATGWADACRFLASRPVRPTRGCVMLDPRFVDVSGEGAKTGATYSRETGLALRKVESWNEFVLTAKTGGCGGLAVVPELERGGFTASPADLTVLRQFVTGGGRLIVHGSVRNFANLYRPLLDLGASPVWCRTRTSSFALPKGTPGLRPQLGRCNHLCAPGLDRVKLPANAQVVYRSGNFMDVARVPLGKGEAVYLSFDWYDGGYEAHGWGDVARVMATRQFGPLAGGASRPPVSSLRRLLPFRACFLWDGSYVDTRVDTEAFNLRLMYTRYDRSGTYPPFSTWYHNSLASLRSYLTSQICHTVVVPPLERSAMPADVAGLLKEFVADGGRLIVHGHPNGVALLNAVGVAATMAPCRRDDAFPSATYVAGRRPAALPSSLDPADRVCGLSRVDEATTLYRGRGGQQDVVLARRGSGTVLYLGFSGKDTAYKSNGWADVTRALAGRVTRACLMADKGKGADAEAVEATAAAYARAGVLLERYGSYDDMLQAVLRGQCGALVVFPALSALPPLHGTAYSALRSFTSTGGRVVAHGGSHGLRLLSSMFGFPNSGVSCSSRASSLAVDDYGVLRASVGAGSLSCGINNHVRYADNYANTVLYRSADGRDLLLDAVARPYGRGEALYLSWTMKDARAEELGWGDVVRALAVERPRGPVVERQPMFDGMNGFNRDAGFPTSALAVACVLTDGGLVTTGAKLDALVAAYSRAEAGGSRGARRVLQMGSWASFATALRQRTACDTAVVPALERSRPSLGPDDLGALRGFMERGGTLVVHGSAYSIESLLSPLFNLNMRVASCRNDYANYATSWVYQPAGYPQQLGRVNSVCTLTGALVSGTVPFYTRHGYSLTTTPVGTGRLVFAAVNAADGGQLESSGWGRALRTLARRPSRACLVVDSALMDVQRPDHRYLSGSSLRAEYVHRRNEEINNIVTHGSWEGMLNAMRRGACGQLALLPPVTHRAPALPASSVSAVRAFVTNGGRFYAHGAANNVAMLNALFGWSVTASSRVRDYTDWAEGGSRPRGMINRLPHNYLVPVTRSSLPSGAKVVYARGDRVDVFVVPYGSGEVVYVANDLSERNTENTYWGHLMRLMATREF